MSLYVRLSSLAPKSHLRQGAQRRLRILLEFLNQGINSLEIRMARIPQDLKHDTLTTGDNGAGVPQPRQGDAPLLGIHTGDPVHNHIHTVATLEQIQRRLCDTDVGLDADDDGVNGGDPRFGEQRLELGRDHGEERLVEVGLDVCAGQMRLQLGDGVTQPGTVLGRDIRGDLEGVCDAEEFGGRRDAARLVSFGKASWGGLTCILLNSCIAGRNFSWISQMLGSSVSKAVSLVG